MKKTICDICGLEILDGENIIEVYFRTNHLSAGMDIPQTLHLHPPCWTHFWERRKEA